MACWLEGRTIQWWPFGVSTGYLGRVFHLVYEVSGPSSLQPPEGISRDADIDGKF